MSRQVLATRDGTVKEPAHDAGGGRSQIEPGDADGDREGGSA